MLNKQLGAVSTSLQPAIWQKISPSVPTREPAMVGSELCFFHAGLGWRDSEWQRHHGWASHLLVNIVWCSVMFCFALTLFCFVSFRFVVLEVRDCSGGCRVFGCVRILIARLPPRAFGGAPNRPQQLFAFLPKWLCIRFSDCFFLQNWKVSKQTV